MQEWAIVIAAPGRTFPKIKNEDLKNFALYNVDGVPCFLLQIVLSEHCGQPPNHVYVRYQKKRTAEYLLNQLDALFPFGKPAPFRLVIDRETVPPETTYKQMCHWLTHKDTILVCRAIQQ